MLIKFILIFILCITIIDIVLYDLLNQLFNNRLNKKYRYYILFSGWVFLLLAIIIIMLIQNSNIDEYKQYRSYFYINTFFLVLYLTKIPFFLFGILFYFFRLLFKKTQKTILKIGAIFSIIILLIQLYGIFIGRYQFKVKRVEVCSKEIPKSFDNFKLVVVADMHLGSFDNVKRVTKGISMINTLNPDIIINAGDMINTSPDEINPYVKALNKLKSKYGSYSVLGNHDMGDYRKWYDKNNGKYIQDLIAKEENAGFRILKNEHIIINNGIDTLILAGIYNWGLPPFKKHGNLTEALFDIPKNKFTILISHDPSHWKAEVLNESPVNLMISGHTHGMQFGINNQYFKWSPSQYKYPEWSGLYTANNKYLYVNQGFGYLGFMARIGILPEITLITLKSKQ